ncbi:Synaptonemal complex central element protein 1 [Galemys pyrenaicus]|uniref:Synaptonemal complex central element protein 1 n=1 Tax=Galemys pyrenaicus TaxID=202257 RepID=A0A8J6A9D9_GALPY|nr:Synaptonemal complex central element protein 1 [Galemys pyrenaicus]
MPLPLDLPPTPVVLFASADNLHPAKKDCRGWPHRAGPASLRSPHQGPAVGSSETWSNTRPPTPEPRLPTRGAAVTPPDVTGARPGRPLRPQTLPRKPVGVQWARWARRQPQAREQTPRTHLDLSRTVRGERGALEADPGLLLLVHPPRAASKVFGFVYTGHASSSQKIDDLMEMVKKLEKGSLEPRVEVLINRINAVQQAKKKASEDLGEARTIWEALQKELDSCEYAGVTQRSSATLSGEKVRLKEILNKKQETLRILRLHCQEKEGEAQRKHSMLQGCKARISALNSQIEEERSKQRQLR